MYSKYLWKLKIEKFYCFRIFVGYSYEPYRIPSRIITLMLLLTSLSLYAAYTANIVALLQSTTDSIKTLSDLLHSPLNLGVQDIVFNRLYFKVIVLKQKLYNKWLYWQKLFSFYWNIGFTRPRQKSDCAAEGWTERAQIELDESRRRSTPHKKWTFCISWYTKSDVYNYTAHIPGRREMWPNWDRLFEWDISGYCNCEKIALFGDNKKWVSWRWFFIYM